MCSSFHINNNYVDNHSNNSENSEDDSIVIDDSITENTSEYDSEDYDSESTDYNTDEGIEYDSIHNEDSEHFYTEKENNKYYIGLCHNYFTLSYTHYLLLSTSVSARTFFNHSYNSINNYLYYYGLTRIPNHNIQIMQLKVNTFNGIELYNVIIKTYWLRLIQRHWKKIYKQRLSIIKQRIKPDNQLYNSIHGTYPLHISKLPSLHGMLSTYQKSLNIKID